MKKHNYLIMVLVTVAAMMFTGIVAYDYALTQQTEYNKTIIQYQDSLAIEREYNTILDKQVLIYYEKWSLCEGNVENLNDNLAKYHGRVTPGSYYNYQASK